MAASLADHQYTKLVDFVTLVNYRLLRGSAQLLVIRITWLIAKAAYDLRSGLDPDHPLVPARVPGKLDFIDMHYTKIPDFAQPLKYPQLSGTARSSRGIRVVMPDKPKVVPIAKPALPTSPPATAGHLHRVHRNQVIVSIGPLVFAVDYAVRITELQGVPRDGSGRVVSISGAVKPPSEEPNPSA